MYVFEKSPNEKKIIITRENLFCSMAYGNMLNSTNITRNYRRKETEKKGS